MQGDTRYKCFAIQSVTGLKAVYGISGETIVRMEKTDADCVKMFYAATVYPEAGRKGTRW